jgi:hypothetical protein
MYSARLLGIVLVGSAKLEVGCTFYAQGIVLTTKAQKNCLCVCVVPEGNCLAGKGLVWNCAKGSKGNREVRRKKGLSRVRSCVFFGVAK